MWHKRIRTSVSLFEKHIFCASGETRACDGAVHFSGGRQAMGWVLYFSRHYENKKGVRFSIFQGLSFDPTRTGLGFRVRFIRLISYEIPVIEIPPSTLIRHIKNIFFEDMNYFPTSKTKWDMQIQRLKTT